MGLIEYNDRPKFILNNNLHDNQGETKLSTLDKRNPIAKAVKLALIAGAAASAVSTSTVIAAEDETEADESSERITITGSRIRRTEFVSNAPVAVIDSAQFDVSGTVNTESLLNTMPQVIPGLDRTSNNPGNGTATVDLRGLGTNRTLVLVNGTRAMPTTAGGTVDINSIPTALIKEVQVLTGGASAVYGSDAVAGVVNFILKDDFEGVQMSAGYETTQEGDGTIYNMNMTLGGNFAEGRGNAVFNMSYTDREELFQGDRDFAQTALFDDGNGGLEPGGSSGIPGTSIFAGGFGPNGTNFAPNSSGIIFEQNGSIREFVTGGQVNDFYNYAPVNYIQLPQERFQITGLGHYDINDNATVYGRAMFTDSRVPQQLAPTPIFQTATFTLDGSPFIDAASQQIISDAIGLGVDTDGDGIDDEARALVRRRLLEVGPRQSVDAFQNFQVQIGLNGIIGDTDWEYDTYYQTGSVTNTTVQNGNVNRDRFNQALLLDLAADPTGGTCQDPSPNGGTSACAPINIFGEGNISQAGADFLKTAVASTQVFDQTVFSASVNGDLLDLPAGYVSAAFGYDHIQNSFSFTPSQDLAAGTIAGFNGAPALSGGYKVDEYYTEFFIPVIEDMLDLELAYRAADYNTVGSVDSYKVSASFQPMDLLRFRAGFNTAVRAPNIGELFAPQSEGFPGATDPCSSNGTDQSAAVEAICASTGVPANVMFTPAIALPAGQVRAVGGGNPDLSEEEADTVTFGVVITPTDELSVSLDYFDIQIDEAVGAFGGGAANILSTCYDPSNARGGIGSEYCNAVNRRADGTIDFVSTSSANVASSTLKGFDIMANWKTEAFDGDLVLNYVATITDENSFIQEPGDPSIECAGLFGSLNCGEPIPEYKHRVTADWTSGDLVVSLAWRYVGEVNDDDDGELYTVEKIDGTNYFDTSLTYNIDSNYRVIFGIDNLFDEEPPILGANDEQSNTYPATYDVFGRTFFFNVTATF